METPRWSYDQLKAILKANARKSELLPPKHSYPCFISLNPEMHGVLNGIRIATEIDDLERWCLIGLKGEKNALFVSDFVKGQREEVPAETQDIEVAKAYAFGIDSIPADIHSHPILHLPAQLSRFRPLARNILSYWAGFSVADIYCLIQPHNYLMAMFLVEGDQNLAVFRTSDTHLVFSEVTPTQEEFSNYWLDRFGHKDYLSALRHPINHLAYLLQGSSFANEMIAKTYHLAFYQGRMDEDLVRVYPPILNHYKT